MNKPNPHRRGGFTIIELLVVIGIIALLIALFFPAIQKVREAASLVQCASNMRQLALAFHHYHHDHAKFPPARILGPYPDMGVTTAIEHSWAIFLLPYIEQGELRRQYNMDLDWRHPNQAAVRETYLKVQMCPSAEKREFDRFADIYTWMAAPSDYTTIMRVEDALVTAGLAEPTGDLRGVINSNEQTRIHEIYDGPSNTLLLIECAGRPVLWQRGQANPAVRVRGSSWADARNAFSIQGSSFAGVTGGGPCPMNCTNDREVYAFHPAGANFAFADGSVRYLSQQITMRVMCQLITRNGGEVILTLD